MEELAVVCGGSWEEYGGGAMAHGQKLHEAARHNRPLPFFWCFVLLSLLSLSSGFAFCTPCSPLSFSLKSPLVLKPVFFPLSPPLSLSVFCFLFFFPLSGACVESGIYRAKGSGIDPIPALLLRRGNEAFLPCHDTGRVGQWVWLAGHDPPGFSL